MSNFRTEIGKVNAVAHNLSYNIYNEYLPKIQTHNKIINSEMLSQLIEDMKNKLVTLQSMD